MVQCPKCKKTEGNFIVYREGLAGEVKLEVTEKSIISHGMVRVVDYGLATHVRCAHCNHTSSNPEDFGLDKDGHPSRG